MAKPAMKNMTSAPTPDLKWQAEDDHRTLMRAAEVMADKSRMAGVRSHEKKIAGATEMMCQMLAAKKLGGKLT